MNIVSSCTDFALAGILSVVRNVIKMIQLIGPILAIISLSITFIKLTANPDDKKLIKRINNSILALLILFFIPVITDSAFGIILPDSAFSSCWNAAKNNTLSGNTEYVPVDDRRKSNPITDPFSYEQGTKKKLDSLTYYYQSNYKSTPFCANGKTVSSSGCGAVSFAMIATSFVDSSYEPVSVANWFCRYKFSLANGGLDEDAVMSQDTLKYYGLKSNVLFDKTGTGNYNYGTTYNSTEGEKILAAVNDGWAVMFGMPGHWSVAGPNSACNESQIYLYNPSRPSSNGCYTPQQLFQYTYNYSNRCNTEKWCGWDVAIALTKS